MHTHYIISLTLLLHVRRVRLTNTDEDNKEKQWPEELYDQLNLYGRRRWELLYLCKKKKSCISHKIVNKLLYFSVSQRCVHLVSPAVRDVLPEQEEKLPEKCHRSKQLPGHDGKLETVTKCDEN